MPISSDIYSQFAPKVVNPLDVQNALGQNAQNQLALQQGRIGVQNALQTQQDSASLRQATQGFTGDAPTDSAALARAGLFEAKQKFDKANQEAQMHQSTMGLNASKVEEQKALAALHQQDTSIKKHDFAVQQLTGANTVPEALQWAAQQHANGTFSDDEYTAGVKSLMAAPDYGQWKQNTLKTGVSAVENMKMQQAKAIADQSNATHLTGIGMQQAGENSRAAAARGTQLTIAGMNPDGTYKNVPVAGPDGSIDLTKVSPEDLAAAYRYKTDGTLPPNMGRGQQGAMESRKLRAISAALDSQAGESPEDARVRQLAAKGDISAINKMRQREVAVGANVKNFDFNADQVLQLSGKVDRTGVPIVNAWVNAGRRAVTGNPDLLAFDTAIKTTVNEFAQIVSGTTSGATAEGEKKKAEALLNAQQTPEGVVAVVNQMRIESQNRMKSFKAQRAESMPTNAPQPAPAGKVVHFGDLK